MTLLLPIGSTVCNASAIRSSWIVCIAGSEDFLLYSYGDLNFDKIIEFDGYYVIKFKSKVLIDGKDILLDYIEPELEKKYENKERKK